ncbi:MAG: FkbM family methyltransferase [Mycobacterium sp.]|nr:FkbM family methyltransferase [Mycobacterium sp.]
MTSLRSKPPGRIEAHAVPRRLLAADSILTAGARRLNFLESEIRGLATVVGSGDVCLDVGAEYGLYSVPLARLVGSTGRVVAVEPTPNLARRLRLTASLLGAKALAVAPVALGAKAGLGELSVPLRWSMPVHGRSYLTDGSLHPGPNSEFADAKTIPVCVQTLDGLCDNLGINRLDFLKIDVEGAELAILEGCEMVGRHRPNIMLEIEDRHLGRFGKQASDVFNLLCGNGYAVFGWLDEQWQSLAGPHPRLRNYLFTPES